MAVIRPCVALSSLVLIASCAVGADPEKSQSASARAQDHASHHPAGGATVPLPDAPPTTTGVKAMKEMHDKMANAKTPAARQSLMVEHMRAMQDGMHTMKGMGGGAAMGGMATKGIPADMAQRQRMMEERMEVMQMMMDMMLQRMPMSGPDAAAK